MTHLQRSQAERSALSGLQRRGVLAGLAALTAGFLSRLTATPAQAANGDPVLVGTTNVGTSPTVITNSSGIAFEGSSSSSIGVLGFSSGNVGMQGQSTSGIGLFGTSSSSVGLLGFSDTNTGLQGQSTSGIGLFGLSSSSVGLFGQSSSGLAGQFVGPVFITGNLSVQGTKSAVVPHPDGSHRLVFCVESPSSYFEDFGRAALDAGSTRVALDPDFAAIVHSADYDVFVTPNGDCAGLYVTNKNPQGFDVRELQAGTSSVEFSYRVVAKRRDTPVVRMPRVAIPPRHEPVDGAKLAQQLRRDA